MKILVIGGSYFFGRWFVEFAAKDHDVTVLNRGNIPVVVQGDKNKVTNLVCDRRDVAALEKLPDTDYDAVVDFCAYNPGDIEIIASKFRRPGQKYIYISTVDIYEKTGERVYVDSPFADLSFYKNMPPENVPPEIGYILGKQELERELIRVAEKYSLTPVSVRPAILYGPANYAPREKMFFDWINEAGQVILPSDTDGFFQFIHVADAAKGVLKITELGADKVSKAYNFCNEKPESYDSFAKALHEAADRDFEEIRLSVSDIINRGIPLPYPLTKAESAIFDTSEFKSLGVETGAFDLKSRRG
ncbi:MAG: NAD-dependent epimerase/dehydratase family protein [Acetatifactor sp.]|nr:NAD-dependent epimerase/dehydratase family protein [Acetatifactor sp.]